MSMNIKDALDNPMKDKALKTFNMRLKELREQKGLSQLQVAEAVGLSRAAIYAYETTGKSPSIDIVMKIAEFFRVSIDWLCGLSSIQKPSVENCGDVALMIAKLVNLGMFQIQSGLHLNGNEYIVTRKGAITCVNCIVPEEPIFRFLEDYKQMFSLLFAGTINDDIFNQWLSKVVSDLEKTPIESW